MFRSSSVLSNDVISGSKFRRNFQVKGNIRELMNIDTDLAVRLLLENEESLPAATVMRQLNKYPRLQLAYLERFVQLLCLLLSCTQIVARVNR